MSDKLGGVGDSSEGEVAARLKAAWLEMGPFFDELYIRHKLSRIDVVILCGWFMNTAITILENERGNTGNQIRQAAQQFVDYIISKQARELPQ